jgi:Zn-dependent protease with chaperone function
MEYGSQIPKSVPFPLVCCLLMMVVSPVKVNSYAASQRDGIQARIDDFGSCWKRFIINDEAFPGFTVASGQKANLDRIASEWRGPELRRLSLDAWEIHARGWQEGPHCIRMILEARTVRGRVIGPIGLLANLTESQPKILELESHPWAPNALFIFCNAIFLLYLAIGFVLLKVMQGNPAFLDHNASWTKRQAFLLYYPIASLLCLIILVIGLSEIDVSRFWFAWLAFISGLTLQGVTNWIIGSFIALYLISTVVFWTPYFQTLRRASKSLIQSSPQSFTLKRILGAYTFQTILQLLIGSVFLGLAFWLTRRHRASIILVSLIVAVLSVITAQFVGILLVRRKACRFLPSDHPIVREAWRSFSRTGLAEAPKKIYVLPTDRWPAPNAFVIGIGRRRCLIAATESLLLCLSVDEIVAVLLHEYAHFWERHTMFLAAFISGVAAWQYIFILEGRRWIEMLGFSTQPVLGIVYMLVSIGGGLLALAGPFTFISRIFEKRADKLVRDLNRGESLASALYKLSAATETPLQWPRWIRWLATHPSSEERIHFLKRPIQSSKEGIFSDDERLLDADN